MIVGMARADKEDWIKAGAQIVAQYGAIGLTIEALCQQLKLTKGSFYHHFAGLEGYKTAFLTWIEAQDTQPLALEPGADPQAHVRAIFEWLERYPRGLAASMQAWALTDDAVRAVQKRVYARQLAAGRGIARAMLPGDEARADTLARLMQTYALGLISARAITTRAQRKAMLEMLLAAGGVSR
jgi:AcrR family transcriptional regulator